MKLVVKICLFFMAAVAMMNHRALVQAQANCAALGTLIPCPRASDAQGAASGQFVCRNRWQPDTNTVRPETLCIATNQGRGTDQCGCCGGVCPQVCGEICPLGPNGAAPYGAWIYDWYSLVPSRWCVSGGRGLQLRQENGSRWRCMQYNGWFARIFGVREYTGEMP
jgi:hypothetical protein